MDYTEMLIDQARTLGTARTTAEFAAAVKKVNPGFTEWDETSQGSVYAAALGAAQSLLTLMADRLEGTDTTIRQAGNAGQRVTVPVPWQPSEVLDDPNPQAADYR
jgi:hypothetical protein